GARDCGSRNAVFPGAIGSRMQRRVRRGLIRGLLEGAVGRLAIVVALASGLTACRRATSSQAPPLLHLIDVTAETQQPHERCDIAGDSRDSLIVSDHQRIAFPVRASAKSVLRYALATRGPSTDRADFEIAIEDENSHALAYSRVDNATAHWIPYEIDLDRFAG